ncbi:hypothetical protein K438DRAFT_1779364 [Mycena galopus ATCC 62051]|nr:hypothetical protein K438DRAFT_1779364 [Mycena galopus ATCC 62051]
MAREDAIEKALPVIKVFDLKIVIHVLDFPLAQKPRKNLGGLLYTDCRMSDDIFLLPSSPSTVYSTGLEYEQSQHKQEARDEQEAQRTPQECESADAYRLAKRRKLGYESLTDFTTEETSCSPGHKENLSPTTTLRPSAAKSLAKTNKQYLPCGLMDSQATSQEAIDALIAAGNQQYRKPDLAWDDITSQDVLDQLPYRRQPVVYTADNIPKDDDFEASQEITGEDFCLRCSQAEKERDGALAELSSVRIAYRKALAAKGRAEEGLARWKRAAVAATPFVELLIPCMSEE